MSLQPFFNPRLAAAIPTKYYDRSRDFLESVPGRIKELLKDPNKNVDYIGTFVKNSGPLSSKAFGVDGDDFRQVAFHALLDAIKDSEVDFNGIQKASDVIFYEFMHAGSYPEVLQTRKDALLARLTHEIRNERPDQPSHIAELLIDKFKLHTEAERIRAETPRTPATPNVAAEKLVALGLDFAST